MSDKTTIGRSHGGKGPVLLDAASRTQVSVPFRAVCGKCGAQRIDSQIGLEDSPAAYVAALVTVFREVKRVLKDDGIAWCNLGDSFQSKQLLGIPWRVAFALQADGWYLRSDVIFSKPNPMPESCKDRPTKAHEYLFLLSKGERYFYDAAAISERLAAVTLNDPRVGRATSNGGTKDYAGAGVQNPSDVRMRINNHLGTHRNKRSVWTIPTLPYAGAHFATMPEALVEPCVLAGSRIGDLILDPFLGSGTVGAVAERLGRRWVGVDLNPAYHALAKTRTAQRGLRWVANE